MVKMLSKIADPVLSNLANDSLKYKMPVEKAIDPYGGREQVTYLEAFGRLLAGMAPWLELGPDDTEEGKLRERYITLAVKGIENATDPNAADYMNFTEGGQPLVDAAFLAEALIRAPEQLWGNLDETTRENVIRELKSTRSISPPYMNWLLFSGMVEAALLKFTGDADMMRIEYALLKHDEWYLGDGIYGDGPDFHWDYYNSYVIQPMILDIVNVLGDKKESLSNYRYRNKFIDDAGVFLERAQRYAAIQERLISPEGTFPPIGRSLAYRCGAFQMLSQIAFFQKLPHQIAPAQVREGLFAVIKNQMSVPGTFDENGWLTIGFYGHQREIAEPYISTGSLYLCSTAFLVLGLPQQTPYWSAPGRPWTQKQIWSGGMAKADHAFYPGDYSNKKMKWDTLIPVTSFDKKGIFRNYWNTLYPWGSDHNGTARMDKSNVILEKGVVELHAELLDKSEGKSKSSPYLPIRYRSGAIHAQQTITVSAQNPVYEISGEFKVPYLSGTWPAFWMTAVDGWPPETDIMEFKGNTINWQNTFMTPSEVTTIQKEVSGGSDNWHTYKIRMEYQDEKHTTISYFIDDEQTGIHYTDFSNKAFWLIINLQMEGSSGKAGDLEHASLSAKNVIVKRLNAE
nr:DUF2264 domain-containing protein [Robertkochia solimangrovi]